MAAGTQETSDNTDENAHPASSAEFDDATGTSVPTGCREAAEADAVIGDDLAAPPRDSAAIITPITQAQLATLGSTISGIYGPDSALARARLDLLSTAKPWFMEGISGALSAISEHQSSLPAQLFSITGPLAGLNAFRDILVDLDLGLSEAARRAFDLNGPRASVTPRETPRSSYSPELTTTAAYFAHTEEVIDSASDLFDAVSRMSGRHPALELVWRGARNAEWGLHSSLFRRLMTANEVASPVGQPTGEQPFPSEHQMISTEANILSVAREHWRLDNTPPLELFAKLQHYGAPTRMIDVTRNPLIGAWFASESEEDTDDVDGRLFAIATGASREKRGRPDQQSSRAAERELTFQGQPVWHGYTSNEQRVAEDWGTGVMPRLWVPAAYDPRITAQNAGFLIDGVPSLSSSIRQYLRINSSTNSWQVADVLAAGSIVLKMAKPSRPVRSNKANLLPVFSWRITPKAKSELRKELEYGYGYSFAAIYPDISGLSAYLTETDDVLTHAT